MPWRLETRDEELHIVWFDYPEGHWAKGSKLDEIDTRVVCPACDSVSGRYCGYTRGWVCMECGLSDAGLWEWGSIPIAGGLEQASVEAIKSHPDLVRDTEGWARGVWIDKSGKVWQLDQLGALQ